MKKPIFTATHIVKTFGPTIALNDVDIEVYPGEIRGFIGENGSGKSTMSQIMTGIYFRNSGSMYFHDEAWEPKSMLDALERGIGIAVQENGTISGNSVAENIFLGELDKFSGVNYFEEKRIVSFSKYFDIDVTDIENKKNELLKSLNDSNKETILAQAKSDITLLAKEHLEELKAKKQSYIDAENKRYDEVTKTLVDDFNTQSNELLNNISKENLDDATKNKKYKFYVGELNKKYKFSLKRADDEHQYHLTAIKNDSHAIHNLKINAINDIKNKATNNKRNKVKDFFLRLFFGSLVNQKKLNRHAKHVLENIGVTNIRPEFPMGMYDIQSRKLVEIAKVLAKNPDIFIVDETTTALSEDGRRILYAQIEKLKAENKAILFISHDLDEIMEKCDTLTVLRDGNIVANMVKEEFDEEVIKKHMIGRELKGDYYRADYTPSHGEKVVLKAENINLDRRLKDINLELHEGEIIGVGGLGDCGMHDLGKVLYGVIHATEGRVLTGSDLNIEIKNQLEAMKHKIGYLPKDRDIEALALNDSIYNNIAIASINNVTHYGVVNKKEEKAIVKEQVEYLQIKCNSANDLVRTLSGGNKQKVSLGKWLGNDSKILILDCPTRGVDIGVKQFIYQLMDKLKKEGYAILMISEELPELIGMSDRLLIMKNGVIAHEFLRSEDLKQEEIVKYML